MPRLPFLVLLSKVLPGNKQNLIFFQQPSQLLFVAIYFHLVFYMDHIILNSYKLKTRLLIPDN